MYTDINFKSKKQLKDAIAAGKQIGVFQPNDMFGINGSEKTRNGEVSVEGPHYPQPHKWYARVTLKDGSIVKVK